MFKKIKQTKSVISHILSKPNYLILFSSISLLSFIIFYMLTVATVTDQSLQIFIMMSGPWFTLAHLFILGIIAVLFGLYISLFVYRWRLRTCKKGFVNGIFGSGGFIVALFSAGCPMCGGVLFALIGAPLALFFLPFKGLELKVLSIILLSISVYVLSRSLIKCDVKRVQ